jgi:hypothetical protein
MMNHRDYETVASALRLSLGYADRVRVYRHLAPMLIANNGKFDPLRFGESLGISQNVCRMVLTDHINKKEVGNARSTEDQHEEVECEEDDREAVPSQVGVE